MPSICIVDNFAVYRHIHGREIQIFYSVVWSLTISLVCLRMITIFFYILSILIVNTRWLSSKNIVKRKNNRPFEQNEYFHRSQWTLSFVLNPRTAQSVHNNDKHAERHSCRLWGCRQTPHQHKYTNWTVLAAAFQHICDTHLKYVLLSIVCLLNHHHHHHHHTKTMTPTVMLSAHKHIHSHTYRQNIPLLASSEHHGSRMYRTSVGSAANCWKEA